MRDDNSSHSFSDIGCDIIDVGKTWKVLSSMSGLGLRRNILLSMPGKLGRLPKFARKYHHQRTATANWRTSWMMCSLVEVVWRGKRMSVAHSREWGRNEGVIFSILYIYFSVPMYVRCQACLTSTKGKTRVTCHSRHCPCMRSLCAAAASQIHNFSEI